MVDGQKDARMAENENAADDEKEEQVVAEGDDEDEDEVPVERLVRNPTLRSIFGFPKFNALQSVLAKQVLDSNENLTVAAPTGSGKTVIMELAICRLLLARVQLKHSE